MPGSRCSACLCPGLPSQGQLYKKKQSQKMDMKPLSGVTVKHFNWQALKNWLPSAWAWIVPCPGDWSLENQSTSNSRSHHPKLFLLLWCWGLNRTCAHFTRALPQNYISRHWTQYFSHSVYLCVCTDVFLSHPPLFFEIGALSRHAVHQISQTNWPVRSKGLPVSTFPGLRL